MNNIRKEDITVTMHCNAGSTSTKLEGHLGSLSVKHNPHCIAKVLALHEAKQRCQVTYDSWDCNRVFQVHTKDKFVEFTLSSHGLHFHDVSNPSSNVELMLVNSVCVCFWPPVTDELL
jgi:hypothetical protein